MCSRRAQPSFKARGTPALRGLKILNATLQRGGSKGRSADGKQSRYTRRVSDLDGGICRVAHWGTERHYHPGPARVKQARWRGARDPGP